MGLSLVTAPETEPLSKDDVKQGLVIDDNAFDNYIEAILIPGSRQKAENTTSRALITQTWDWTLDRFPPLFHVPKPPLQSVTQISYVDTEGTTQVLASTEYDVDITSTMGRIALAYGKTWPNTRNQINAVTVQFVCGYGESQDIPPDIKRAMLLMMGSWNEHREDVAIGQAFVELPQNAESILMDYNVSWQ